LRPSTGSLGGSGGTYSGGHLFRRQEGTWDESRQTATDTICAYCGVGCTLTVHVQDEKIVKVTSPIDHDMTRGHLCIKGGSGGRS
jgi:predicted molibdopterin-dependent oxidoreductase YjgC